jgi:hypothetical protein
MMRRSFDPDHIPHPGLKQILAAALGLHWGIRQRLFAKCVEGFEPGQGLLSPAESAWFSMSDANPPQTDSHLTLLGRGQRINEIVEILVAIFFICLNIKCFRL